MLDRPSHLRKQRRAFPRPSAQIHAGSAHPVDTTLTRRNLALPTTLPSKHQANPSLSTAVGSFGKLLVERDAASCARVGEGTCDIIGGTVAVARRPRKRAKRSGVVYFAVNSRIPGIVKIGMTTDSAERRLELANRKHEFMCGIWSITQKVKTNDAKRTESLAHTLFEDQLDPESVSTEMYFIPTGMTVKQMADLVREKDKVYVEHMEEEETAKAAVLEAQKRLDELHRKHKEQLTRGLPGSQPTTDCDE